MSDIDKTVLALLEKVELKKAQIKPAGRTNWKTHCSFTYNPERPERISLQVIRDPNNLIPILAWLKNKYESEKAAANELGITNYKFEYLGFSFEDWEGDIKMCANKLMVADQKAALAKLEGEINALVSPEQRRKIEVERLQKALENG